MLRILVRLAIFIKIKAVVLEEFGNKHKDMNTLRCYHDGKENDNSDRRMEIVHEKNDRKL